MLFFAKIAFKVSSIENAPFTTKGTESKRNASESSRLKWPSAIYAL